MWYAGRMARDQSQRDDLLAEATALVERVEIVPLDVHGSSKGDESSTPIVAGFRADGALSLFFGEDPVYQFNEAGELRRAYVGAQLYKALGGRLVELTRVRLPNQVELRRRELPAEEDADFLLRMCRWLTDLKTLLDAGNFQVVGQIPPDANVIDRVRNWLVLSSKHSIAKRPNV
jgi:hypothetical protein